MTTLREAAQQALEALEYVLKPTTDFDKDVCQKLHDKAIAALRAALAEPVQEPEPVAWMDREGDLYKMPEIKGWAPPHTMLYTAPPQRKPLPERRLTDEVIADLWYKHGTFHHHFARAIERWLKGEQ